MTIDSIGSSPLDASKLGKPEKPKAAETAADFEALMIGQMLKSARSGSEGWFGTGEDSSSASLVEMAEEQIAKVLAKNGGLGLAGMIKSSIDQTESSTVQMSGKLR